MPPPGRRCFNDLSGIANFPGPLIRPADPMPSTPPIRILLADASELLRCGVKAVLAAEGRAGFDVVGETNTHAGAVSACMRLQPDIVLLDLCMGGPPTFTACCEILQRRPETRIVVLTATADDALVCEAVKVGAKGFLKKDIAPKHLVQALRDVAAGRAILDPDATMRVLRLLRGGGHTRSAGSVALLSAQEHRVLALVANGLTNRQVGQQLHLSENTVKNYLVNAFEKLNVKRRAQAAALFVQHSAPERRAASG